VKTMSGSYVLRNIDCLLNLQGNAQPSGKNTLILAAMYHPGNFVPMFMIRGRCACFRAKTVEISGHLPGRTDYKRGMNPGTVRRRARSKKFFLLHMLC